jgi:hypothetical protein
MNCVQDNDSNDSNDDDGSDVLYFAGLINNSSIYIHMLQLAICCTTLDLQHSPVDIEIV